MDKERVRPFEKHFFDVSAKPFGADASPEIDLWTENVEVAVSGVDTSSGGPCG